MYKKIVVLVLTFCSVNALSESFDVRSTGMGGIGVTTASYLTAAFHNPALVANYKDNDDIGILLPYVGASVQNPDDIVSKLDDFDDHYQGLSEGVLSDLNDLQNSAGHMQVGVGMAISFPNKYVSVSLFAKTYLDAFILADISPNDLGADSYKPNQEIDSQSVTMGVAITEFGVALAKSFNLKHGELYIGFSPKYQIVNTINYVVSLDDYDFDDWDNSKYQNVDGNFNLDAGIAFKMSETYLVGFAAKNLISNEYKTTTSQTGVSGVYEINPVYTVSASYSNNLFTAGIDVDLNETKRYEITGLRGKNVPENKDNTQMAGVGLEFNAWDWGQARVGYQYDIAGSVNNQFTAGLGISPFGVLHLDFAATYSGDSQFGVGIQSSLTF